MKNLDIKKLIVLVLIIAIIGLIVFFIVRGLSEDKIPDEDKKIIETKIDKYYSTITYGFNTQYSGIDILYNSDKIVYDDLTRANVLYIATKYVSNNNIENNITNTVIENIQKKTSYGDLSNATYYTGESIRKAIKELFGVNILDSAAKDNFDYIYDFQYDQEYDIYIMQRNKVQEYSTPNEYMDYSLISMKKDKDKVKVTIAIAYVYDDGTNINYYKDRNGENVVAENVTEFPEDKIDEFTKYTFTLNKVEEDYIFESIERN